MRLIDADVLIEAIKNMSQRYCDCKDCDGRGQIIRVSEVIDIAKYEVPTAYDIDKVVDELEKELSLADKEKERCTGENNLQFDSAKGYASGISTAIEIVKQVGVSDDVCEWKYNDSEYYWESSCEHLHIFMSDGPEENEYKFCPYCGKKIKVVE